LRSLTGKRTQPGWKGTLLQHLPDLPASHRQPCLFQQSSPPTLYQVLLPGRPLVLVSCPLVRLLPGHPPKLHSHSRQLLRPFQPAPCYCQDCRKCRTPETSIEAENCIFGEPEPLCWEEAALKPVSLSFCSSASTPPQRSRCQPPPPLDLCQC